MAGGIGREAIDIGAIAGIAVSGKIPTTAAGGGSNVAITNISGNVRAVIQGVNITSSALDTNAVLNATEVAVTAGATPLPVNVVQTSAQIHVTAGGANLPVTVASQPIAVSVNAGVMVSGQIKTTAVGAGGASVAITNVSGNVPITAGGTPLPVNVVNVSGQVQITAATPIPVLASISGQVNVTATNNIGVSAAGTLNVSAGGAYLSAIDTATSGTRALTSAVMANTSAIRLDIDRLEAAVTASALDVRATFSGVTAAAVTAAGGVPLPVNVVNTSGQISVTAPTNIPVTVAAQPIAVSIAAKAAIDVSAQGAALQVTAQGGSFAVSAQGGSLSVNVANISGNVKVTAANGVPLPVNQLGVNVVNSAAAAYDVVRGDAVYNAAVSNPVKFGKLAQVAGAVCADIVAAVASRRIRVLGGYFNSTGTATAIFMTTGASAALTPKIVINTGFVLPINPYGYFETAVGSALTLQVEGGSVGGIITYQEVF